MSDFKLKDLLELVTVNDLQASTSVEFKIGGRFTRAKDVSVRVIPRGYNTVPKVIVDISDERIDEIVQNRMKDMFEKLVEDMFKKEAKEDED